MPKKLNQPPLELTGPEFVALIGNAERRYLAQSLTEHQGHHIGDREALDYIELVTTHETQARAHLRRFLCDSVAVEHLPRALNLFDTVDVNPGILLAMFITGDIVLTGMDEAIGTLPKLDALMRIYSKGEYGL
ncbi:gp47 [Corynebacterium phage BFK20]|uniref:Gp47 n=1 Tax=Corynebacterium phage BFK20 TaxID=28358 RepID=Q3V5E8_9CAUD|nr:gp47 [Corynebacterium phage BFK20]CAJ29730.1 gp47 [Corynebacterium phage BFK20]